MYLMGQILFQLKSPPNFHVTEYMLSQPNARRVSIFFCFHYTEPLFTTLYIKVLVLHAQIYITIKICFWCEIEIYMLRNDRYFAHL